MHLHLGASGRKVRSIWGTAGRKLRSLGDAAEGNLATSTQQKLSITTKPARQIRISPTQQFLHEFASNIRILQFVGLVFSLVGSRQVQGADLGHDRPSEAANLRGGMSELMVWS